MAVSTVRHFCRHFPPAGGSYVSGQQLAETLA